MAYHPHNTHHRPPYYYNPYSPSSSTYSQPAAPPLASPVSPLVPARRLGTSSPSYFHDAPGLSTPDPFVSPTMSRSPSVAGSDRFSTISGVTGYWPQNPNDVSPAAAYVASFGAKQVVNDHRGISRPTDYSDDEESAAHKDDARFTPAALSLVNAFLDQLLYSILSTARSTNLYKLRPAVTEVLKHRLAHQAISNADEELQELLAGGEEEEEETAQKNSERNSNPTDHQRRWDLELVWKRTRLRVMVYMRLGEMEDEDEERHVREQELYYGREPDRKRFSADSGLVSWSAAIFLTSVLEYVAEQTLQVAGGAAHTRSRRQSRTASRPSLPLAETANHAPSDAVTVEEHDVERVALDARLGRLWRTWRKTLRNDQRRPSDPTHRTVGSRSSFSRDGPAPAMTGRRDSEVRNGLHRRISQSEVPEMGYPEHVLASNIPLPMSDAKRDVDEIEVPGLARDPEQSQEDSDAKPVVRERRKTFRESTLYQLSGGRQVVPEVPVLPTENATEAAATKPAFLRKRSNSVPMPQTPMFDIPGAFPREPTETKPVAVEEAPKEEAREEQKFSAVEMADHKRGTEDVKVLLDKVAEGSRPAAVGEGDAGVDAAAVTLPNPADDDALDSPRAAPLEEDVLEQKMKSEDHTLLRAAPSEKEAPEQKTKSEDPALPGAAPLEEEAPEQKTKSEDHTILGAAGAGVAVVAGAAGAALAKLNGEDHSKSEENNISKPEVKSLRADPTLTPEATLLGPIRRRTPREIEELDNRKSLGSMKGLIAGDSAARSRSVSREPSPRLPALDTPPLQPASLEPPADLTRSSSVETDRSFTLGNKQSSKEAIPQAATPIARTSAEDKPASPKMLRNERPDAAIGMARSSNQVTNDTPAESPTTPKARDVPVYQPASSEQPISPKARTRPERLIINSGPPPARSNGSPVVTPLRDTSDRLGSSDSPSSPQDFLQSRNLSLTGKVQPQVERLRDEQPLRQQSLHDRTRASPPKMGVGAVGVPIAWNGVTQSPVVEKGTEYKVWQPASQVEQKSDATPKSQTTTPRKQTSGPAVQEHPAVLQMGSPKRDKKQLTHSTGSGTPPAVHGAKVRGIEDFDSLIKSDDTVKYTLTPETVRDKPVITAARTTGPERILDSSRASNATRLPAQASAGAPTPAPRGPIPAPPTAAESVRTGRSGTSKHVTAAETEQRDRSSTGGSQTPTSNKERRRSFTKPTPRNGSAHRKSGLTAREPQVLTESTRDFADFIRSTGPDREPDTYRLNTSKSASSLHSLGSQAPSFTSSNGAVGDQARERTKSLSKSEMAKGDIPPVPPVPTPSSSARTRSNLQARSATGAATGSSDLINFIRDGPDEGDSHRISRSVAPFRNTMDSDQFADMGAKMDYGMTASPPRGGSKATPPPARTSSLNTTPNGTGPRKASLANSASGKPRTPPTAHPAHSGKPPTLAAPTTNGDGKKRYRNKDPYAIDLSDFDEDDLDLGLPHDHLTALPRSKPREESLADFLRNSEPPDNNAPRPVGGVTGRDGAQAVLEKARASTRQSLNAVGADPLLQTTSPPQSQQGQGRRGSALTQPGPRAPNANSNPPVKRAVGVPRVEAGGGAGARLGLQEKSNTGDLAEFLRSSGPPEPVAGKVEPEEMPTQKKKRSGLFGWGRWR